MYKIFAVNPGSTSTKIAAFEDTRIVFSRNVEHSGSVLRTLDIPQQYDYREKIILDVLKEEGLSLEGTDAFVGRAGSVCSIVGGAYRVNELMLNHARHGNPYNQIKHPAMLGPLLVHGFSQSYGGLELIVNPPDVDELDEVARITGWKGLYRKSSLHALNQKEVALRYAEKVGKDYNSLNLIICHIGGGISVTAHRQGKMVDSNDIARGDGPMAPTRSGTLPAAELIDLCMSGKYTKEELHRMVIRNGGLMSHLGVSDAREVRRMMDEGDRYAALVYDAMIYQIAKEAGSRAIPLKGKVDAVILTGGIAHDPYLVERLTGYVDWIAPVEVMAGEFEMEALAHGAFRVLSGKEEAREYSGIPVWTGPMGQDAR